MPNFEDAGLHDFMARSTVLRRFSIQRTEFDPKNPEHLESLKHFINTGNWKAQFLPEYPFTDVPMTVLMKYAAAGLGADPANRTPRIEAVKPEAADRHLPTNVD